jgi:hypothetical protein
MHGQVMQMPFGGASGMPLGSYDPALLAKALTVNYGTDVATLTGGAALRVQSLDRLLYDTVWSDPHIKAFKLLKATPTESTVDEWVERAAYGAPWGAVAGEADNPPSTVATLARRVGYVKYYRTYREVSHPATVIRNIVAAIAEEEQAGALYLAACIERDIFFGDANIIPEQFDGLLPLIIDQGNPRAIIDRQGQPLNERELILTLAAEMGAKAGVPTHFFVDPYSQSDLDRTMMDSERFVLPQRSADNQYAVDFGIGAVRTSFGTLTIVNDIFLAPERGWFTETEPLDRAPTSSRGGDANNPAPAAPTVVTPAAAGTGGLMPAGDYFYRVSSINKNGESASTASALVQPTAGQKVTLTIESTDANITGFRIYRSAVGAGDATDCRFLYHCPRTGASVDFVDDGSWVPGTTCAFAWDTHPGDPAVDFRQLLPMMKLDLAVVKPAIPWLQMLYGYLRVTRPLRLGLIKNILPSQVAAAGWNPLGV